MSNETWEAEFYPISAEDAVTGRVENTILHSLQKWRGLTKESLAKHGVRKVDDLEIEIDASSCALCHRYLYKYSSCAKCPLYRCLGHVCDAMNGPYHAWAKTEDPQPMIKALQGTLRAAAGKGVKDGGAKTC